MRHIPSVLEAMLKAKFSMLAGELLSVFVQNILKLYTQLLIKHESEDDWDSCELI